MKVKKSFTLMEVLVVVVILGIGVGGGITAYRVADEYIEKSNLENLIMSEVVKIEEDFVSLDIGDDKLNFDEDDGWIEIPEDEITNERLKRFGATVHYKVIPQHDVDTDRLLYKEITVEAEIPAKNISVATQSIKVNIEEPLAVCVTDCAGKECGSDGCEGFCGDCIPPQVCNVSGECEGGGINKRCMTDGSGVCSIDGDGIECDDGNDCPDPDQEARYCMTDNSGVCSIDGDGEECDAADGEVDEDCPVKRCMTDGSGVCSINGDGEKCDAVEEVIDWDCLSSGICGDGTQDTGEECDDGEFNGELGYCNEDCSGTTAGPKSCTVDGLCVPGGGGIPCTENSDCSGPDPNLCGNGVRDPGEDCDDGNANGNECTPPDEGECTYCSTSCEEVTVEWGECEGDLCDGCNCTPWEQQGCNLGDCSPIERYDTRICNSLEEEQCDREERCVSGTEECAGCQECSDWEWGECGAGDLGPLWKPLTRNCLDDKPWCSEESRSFVPDECQTCDYCTEWEPGDCSWQVGIRYQVRECFPEGCDRERRSVQDVSCGCECTSWEDIRCSGGDCPENLMLQRRQCLPSDCDETERCCEHRECED